MMMRPAAGLTAALLCLAALGRCHKDENNNECYATDRVTGPYVQQIEKEKCIRKMRVRYAYLVEGEICYRVSQYF